MMLFAALNFDRAAHRLVLVDDIDEAAPSPASTGAGQHCASEAPAADARGGKAASSLARRTARDARQFAGWYRSPAQAVMISPCKALLGPGHRANPQEESRQKAWRAVPRSLREFPSRPADGEQGG
jgi:hypothetical protein